MSPPSSNALQTAWDPRQYLKFSDHRLRPALELLDRVPLESPKFICDLGCGAGQITRLIAQRWPSAQVIGVDHSKQMLEEAAAEPSRVQWMEADLRAWSPPRPPELIYSNATLHWIEEHRELFPRLMHFLQPGGWLAVQMPLSWEAPSHRLMRETLASGGANGSALGSVGLRREANRKWVEEAQFYCELLESRAQLLDIWETEYLQILEGPDPVFEWVKGTGLRPILTGLPEPELEAFLAEYKKRLRVAYPPRAGGRTLYPFRRLFIVAQKAS